MTYSDYARRGFFELVAAAVLAGMLVVCLELAVRWRSRAQLAAGLALLALTGVVLVSAFVRLRLYQEAYGWTELRFVVLTAIVWLAVALVATAWLVLARQTRWTLHALGMLSVVTLVAMNLVGPQAYVAERNLERALDPALVPPGGRTGLDGAYLATLGDEAVPPVVAAFDRLGPADRVALSRFLHARELALATDPALAGWPSRNVTRERAREALGAWTGR
jgi:FlaA1/EpsC-like NDP-sugar epimerase